MGLLCLTWITFTGQTNDTIFIDPTHSGPEDGSINNPFDSWDDVEFQNDCYYLQKRGTTTVGNMAISGTSGLVVGAYGTGPRPVITGVPGSETRILAINNSSNNILIENISFKGDTTLANRPTAAVYFAPFYGDVSHITIRNCDIRYCYNGIRGGSGNFTLSHLTIDSVNLNFIGEDGIFLTNTSNVTIKNSVIAGCNWDWHWDGHDLSESSGDGIQVSFDCDNILLENVIIDRSQTGNKFCFIHNGDQHFTSDITIRDCWFIPPKDTVGASSAGGCIYLGRGDTALIERTRFGGPRYYDGEGSKGNIGGQVSFDHIIMRYCVFDSLINFSNAPNNEDILLSNVTATGNDPGSSILRLNWGSAAMVNCAVAAGQGTTPVEGDINETSTIVYEGNIDTWDNYFGWTDSGHADYSISAASILYNQGVSTNDTLDYLRNIVPVEIQDIGAFEYQTGNSSLAPVPEFDAWETQILVGEQIAFYDLSDNDPTSWLWSFEGGTPSTSTQQNPVVTYPVAGVYDVTLTVDNVYGSGQLIKNGFIEVNENPIDLEITVILEGAFVKRRMSTHLNQNNLIPHSQPFNADPWNYPGSESVSAIPNSNIVDWVLIELRQSDGEPETATIDSVVARKAGFLLIDGRVVSMDGFNPLSFNISIDRNLYVVVRHRNHLSMMSAFVLRESNGLYRYNFTNSAYKSLGETTTEIIPGQWGAKSGDGDANNHIDNIDKNEVLLDEVGSTGYHSGDFNLDGTVNFKDFSDEWLPNTGNGFSLP